MNVTSLRNVSTAAAGLCEWVINIEIYYNVVVTVEPKKKAVAEGQGQLDAANAKKAEVDALVAKLNAEVGVLIAAYDEAMRKKQEAEDKANKCEMKLNLASRLLNALGAEKDRWAQSIIDLDANLEVIIGDVLLASAFVSYVGPFNK
jgi:dynein heavy chain